MIKDKCEWNNPGYNPYTGKKSDAVDRYQDIPVLTREVLKYKLEKGLIDDIVIIGKTAVTGANQQEYSSISYMHFGKSSVCRSVDTSKWPANHTETGMVYCQDGHCLVVPTVCGNVSRISRISKTEHDIVPFKDHELWVPPQPDLLIPPMYTVPEPSTAILIATSLCAAAVVKRICR